MKAALVIMAAGLGSRYGGNKQVDGVGPGGEILMEYSIHDAIRAGFTKVVFIIKDDMVDLMRTLCGDRIAGLTARDGEPVEVCYAVQDYSSLPVFYTVPAGRTKPFGTTHAVLCARPYVQEPFCVINADDYYGVDAYRAIYQELGRLPQQGKATMVGYLLRNTVSAHGTVSRGVCHGGWPSDRYSRGSEDPAVPRRQHRRRGRRSAPGAGGRYAGVHELLGLYAVYFRPDGGIFGRLPAGAAAG